MPNNAWRDRRCSRSSAVLEGQRLLVRTDAGPRIGWGHFVRSLALAQAWRAAGGRAAFALSRECAAEADAWLETEGMEAIRLDVRPGSSEDALRTRDRAREGQAAWVVLDGYDFGLGMRRMLREGGARLLVVDDMGTPEPIEADLILNSNLHAGETSYPRRGPESRLLLGSDYVLLRRDFLPHRDRRRAFPEAARKVLVTLGGGEVSALLERVVAGVRSAPVDGLEVRVAAGIHTACDMPDLMAWADLAVSGGGSTCWELAFMGLPALVVTVADNQRPVAERLEADGLAENLGFGEAVTPERIAAAVAGLLRDVGRRQEMSRAGRSRVDGRGGERVVACMREGMLTLRQAREADCRLLWEWANDPQVRSVSFTSDPIPWEDHAAWFRKKLRDAGCRIYIAALADGRPVGQARCEMRGAEAVLSVSLDSGFRGRGYGRALIRRAAERFFRQRPEVKALHAYVKPGNAASEKAFSGCGFRDGGSAEIGGTRALHFVLEKKNGHAPCF